MKSTSTGALSAEIPRRVRITVDVPERLNPKTIDDQVNLMSSRLRFVLSQHYQAQLHERVVARISARQSC
jgi:hypothetical protein